MDWFVILVKVLGASTPLSAVLVQLLSEIESQRLKGEFDKLSDPISSLHPDVQELSRGLYKQLKTSNDVHINLQPNFSKTFSRPIAILSTKCLFNAAYSLSSPYADKITLSNPAYIFYMCKLAEDNKAMQKLVERVDQCPIGENLFGTEMAEELKLPKIIIQTIFEIYDKAGIGLSSSDDEYPVYQGIS